MKRSTSHSISIYISSVFTSFQSDIALFLSAVVIKHETLSAAFSGLGFQKALPKEIGSNLWVDGLLNHFGFLNFFSFNK